MITFTTLSFILAVVGGVATFANVLISKKVDEEKMDNAVKKYFEEQKEKKEEKKEAKKEKKEKK